MSTVFFLDSHGGLWATCELNHPGAEAFGPTGVAREATPEEAGLAVQDGETAYSAARRAGRLVEGECEEWPTWDTLIA